MASANKTPSIGVREQVASFKGALNAKQLAEILGISDEMIYKLARRGLIPHFRVSTSVRFDPRAICEWLDKRVL